MNILHLSDIHFGRNYPKYKINEQFDNHAQILDDLISTMSNLDVNLRPRHILFTGDIAWRASRDEFDEAYKFFDKLLSSLGLSGEDISFCPGNHDIERFYRCIDEEIEAGDTTHADKYYEYENIHLFEPMLNNYNDFCRRLGVIPYSYPVNNTKKYSYSCGFKDVKFDNSQKLRIYSFNTSMLQSQVKIRGDKLWLGKPQIDSLISHKLLPSDKSVGYSVALFHHPDRFLDPNETNSYENRNAPLPRLQELTDLSLCGHTESYGKPRLTKLRGGGYTLLGGATYYNDIHQNAFSMLYINPKTKSLGFIPYVYEDGWNDYNFDRDLTERPNEPYPEDAIKSFKNAKLICEGDENFEIKLACLEQTSKGYNNSKDFLNHFQIFVEEELNININNNLIEDLDCMLAYNEFLNHKFDHFKLVTCDNQILFESDSANFSNFKLPNSDKLPELYKVEQDYSVKFKLYKPIESHEIHSIDILCDLKDHGIYSYQATKSSVELVLSKPRMEELLELLNQGKDVYLTRKIPFETNLLNIDIKVWNTLKLKGPYYVDIDDLKYKIETFKDNDQRIISFVPKDGMTSNIITDHNLIATKFNNLPIFET